MSAAHIRKVLCDDSGATLVEYSMVVALVSIACVVAVTFLGAKIYNMWHVWDTGTLHF
jgi:Flp pilus assembly pilin Flp